MAQEVRVSDAAQSILTAPPTPPLPVPLTVTPGSSAADAAALAGLGPLHAELAAFAAAMAARSAALCERAGLAPPRFAAVDAENAGPLGGAQIV